MLIHDILPVLRGRFDSNEHVVLRIGLPALCVHEANRCDIFGMLETENGKLTRQECKQRYLYIFRMTDKTGGSNRSSSRTRS